MLKKLLILILFTSNAYAEIDTHKTYLNRSGSNANQNISIGAYDFSAGTLYATDTGSSTFNEAPTLDSLKSKSILGTDSNGVIIENTTAYLTSVNLTTSTTTNLTGFIKGNGSVLSADNSTYVSTTATATRTLVLTSEGATSNASSGVTFGTLATADSQNYNYCIFNASTISYASWTFVMPNNYDGGTITAKVYWSHPATTTNFGVMWGVQARALGNNEALTGAWVSSLQEVADTGGTTATLYISDATPAITIANTPVAGDMVHLLLRRDPDDANDTLAVDAYVHRVVITYGINSYTE